MVAKSLRVYGLHSFSVKIKDITWSHADAAVWFLQWLWVGSWRWAISISSKKKDKETISFGPCNLVTELHTFLPYQSLLTFQTRNKEQSLVHGLDELPRENLAQLFLVWSITMIRATQKRANSYLLAWGKCLWRDSCWLQLCRLNGHVLCQPYSHKVFVSATWPIFRPAVRWCSWEQRPRPP